MEGIKLNDKVVRKGRKRMSWNSMTLVLICNKLNILRNKGTQKRSMVRVNVEDKLIINLIMTAIFP